MIGRSVGIREITRDKWRAFSIALPFLLVAGAVALLSAGVVIAQLFGGVFGTLGLYAGGALIGAGVMAIIVILRQDELAIVIIVAIHVYVDWYLGLSLIAQIMELALLCAFFLARSPRYPWAEPRALWLWVLFIVLSIYPATHGISLTDTLNYYFNIIFGSLTIFWLGTVIARNTASVRLCFNLLALFATLLAIHTIIQTITGVLLFGSPRYDAYYLQIGGYYRLGETGFSRAGSILINPDSNGGFFAMMLFIPLGLFAESPSLLRKLLYLAQLFLMLLALLFTFSTGGWLAAGAGLIAFLALVGYKRYRVLIPLCIVIAAIVVMLSFPAEVNGQLQHATDPTTALLRVAGWESGIRVILAHPLAGLGIGRYVYFEGHAPYRVPLEWKLLAHPHNSYIEIGALAGLPVLFIFMALLALAFWLAFRNWLRSDAPTRSLLAGGLAAVISLSANSVVVNGWTLIPLAAIGWLIFGIISSPLLAKNLDREVMKVQKRAKNAQSLNSWGGG